MDHDDTSTAADLLGDYLPVRAAKRDAHAEAAWGALTERERALVLESAVLGYVHGARAAGQADAGPGSGQIPANADIVRGVLDAAHHSFADLYPTLAALGTGHSTGHSTGNSTAAAAAAAAAGSERSSRTRVYIDVDGVLSPIGGVRDGTRGGEPDDVVEAELMPGTMTFRRPVLDWLARISRDPRVAAVWCTSWEDDAHAIGELAGAAPMPVSHRKDYPHHRFWKEGEVLRALHRGMRVVWIDDDLPYRLDHHSGPAGFTAYHGSHRALLIAPDSSVGLTDEHIEAIEAFIAAG